MSGLFWKRIHLALSVVWFLIGIAALTVIPALQHSIAFLVWVSIYANFIGHVSSFQAARVEEIEE